MGHENLKQNLNLRVLAPISCTLAVRPTIASSCKWYAILTRPKKLFFLFEMDNVFKVADYKYDGEH